MRINRKLQIKTFVQTFKSDNIRKNISFIAEPRYMWQAEMWIMNMSYINAIQKEIR